MPARAWPLVAQLTAQKLHFTVKSVFYALSTDVVERMFATRAIAVGGGRWHSNVRMRWAFFLGILGLFWAGERAEARPPLGDPVSLNIGINCQWQQACMKTQSKAMKRALNYVRKTQPPLWRVQLCNRNAGRQRVRVDWVGFDNCIRNATLRPIPAAAIKPPPPRSVRKKVKRLTENAPPPAAHAQGPGERG